MKIKNVEDSSFRRYGRVLEGYQLTKLLEEMERTPLPRNVVYEPSVQELESLKEAEAFRDRAFGGLPIQVGYCNGNNHTLNALEYHRTSEINIAVTDVILLLGAQQDIEEDYSYDTSLAEGFFVPARTIVELYATTLHYAPCTASEGGFRCMVILPAGTNTELTFAPGTKGEDKLAAAKNKWLIAHPEAGIEGAFCGLKGGNITVL